MKKFILSTVFFLASFATMFGQETNYQLSSHILDITKGKPASNVKILLSKKSNNDKWQKVDEKFTDSNGRVKDFLPLHSNSNVGIYKLTFYTEEYFKLNNTETFYPFVEVVFEIKDNDHYHVPITLTPFGYSTYRGS